MTGEVSTVYLRDAVTGQPVLGELWDGIGPNHLDDWSNEWQPLIKKLLRDLPREQWPQNWHWDWERKSAYVSGLLGARTFAVVAQGVTQGFMSVDLTRSARLETQRGKPLVYIDYVESAPWNRRDLVDPIRLRGVGTVLVTTAIELSHQEGFRGRVGLHSLRQSEGFYRDTCGMSDLQPDAGKEGLRYFEMTPEQARTFFEEDD